MKITYITKYPTLDIHNWSGTEYFMAKSLENQGQNLEYISGLNDEINWAVRFKSKILSRNKKYLVNRSPELGQGYARQILKRMSPDTDVIFSPSTEPIAYLDCNKPKVFYTDATFACMLGYNTWFDNMSRVAIKEAFMSEKRALETCSLAIYSSDWAAQSAINDFHTNPDKVKVVPFGANIENEIPYPDVMDIIGRRDRDVCKIMFLAVNWEMKGGPIVIEAVKQLNEAGLKCELHIAGINNIDFSSYPWIKNYGFIDKKTEAGQLELQKVISGCHFLFLPTKMDCTPIVFSEANSMGVPVISTRTGGITSIIKDNVNGITFSVDSEAEDFVRFIYTTFTDYNRYIDLSKSSYNQYKTVLNWDTAGKTIMKYLKEV